MNNRRSYSAATVTLLLDSAGLYVVLHRVIGNPGHAPGRRHHRIAMNSELHHKAGHDPEEASVIVEAVLHEVIKPVGAVGSPRACDLDNNLAFAGIEVNLVCVGRLLL